MMGLTPLQGETLAFITAYTDEAGFAPSYSEIQGALGLASKSGVVRLIIGLEERGHIRRIPHRSRAIEIIEPFETMTTADLIAARDRINTILRGRSS